jgi:hypothetical protein
MATFNELFTRANQISIAQITRSILPKFVGDLLKDILLFFQNGFSGNNLKIEAKFDNQNLYIRHGVLPDNIDIVLLRKKHRNKFSGDGRPNRTKKTAWFWAYKAKLSKGINNKWYIPTVISGENIEQNIGQNLTTFIQQKIYVQSVLLPSNKVIWRLRGIRK